MKHISTTPFGRRPVTAGLLATRALAETPAPQDAPDKWAILRDLTAARAAFGVSDRDLAVLNALASFHPSARLDEGDCTVVFPSNAALSDRAHGMAESTLRRHLAALATAGLILRHDSPNGKRYATRDEAGAVAVAFGFDLRPLLVRSAEIARAAQAARNAEARLRRQREAAVLRLRDCAKLIDFGRTALAGPWDMLADRLRALQGSLRRKLGAQDIDTLDRAATELLETVNQSLIMLETKEMGGNDVQNERHLQDSNILLHESEPCHERQEAEPSAPDADTAARLRLPLYLVLKACPDVLDYARGRIGHWHELVGLAEFVRPMLGISADGWSCAKAAMGAEAAAVVIACILQRADAIRKPGGYLRALTAKAEAGAFSPGPMVMALLRAENPRPS